MVGGLEAAGMRINGKPFSLVAATDPVAYASIINACTGPVRLEVMKSGALSETAAAKIAQCDLGASVAACQQLLNNLPQQQQKAQKTVNAQQQSMRSGASGSKPVGWLGAGILGLVVLGAALLLP